MEQLETVRRAQRGNEDAFCMLMRDRKEDIYRIAYSYVKNKDDALDIVHEASMEESLQRIIWDLDISTGDVRQLRDQNGTFFAEIGPFSSESEAEAMRLQLLTHEEVQWILYLEKRNPQTIPQPSPNKIKGRILRQWTFFATRTVPCRRESRRLRHMKVCQILRPVDMN